MASLPMPQLSLAALDAADEAQGRLPPLAFSPEDPASPPLAAMPGSGFIDQSVRGFSRTLPASFFSGGADLGVLLGHAGGDIYAAGVGWTPVAKGPRRVKVSLLRQQVAGEAFDGQWLVSMQGEARGLPLWGGANLLGELAVARRDAGAAELDDTLGARIRLAKSPAGGLGYGLTLSQFGEAFQPVGSRVNAGRRRVAADLQYSLWSEMRLTAHTSYAEFGTGGAPQRCEHHSDLTLAGPVLEPWVPSLKARLEASMLRALDCAGEVNRLVERWKLSLAEDAWTSWNLRMALSTTEIELPRAGNTMVNRSYRLESRRDLRLGRYSATFGPALTLRTHSAGRVQRRFNAGVVVGIDSRLHNIDLRMGYESLDGPEHLRQREAVNVDLSYELNFGV